MLLVLFLRYADLFEYTNIQNVGYGLRIKVLIRLGGVCVYVCSVLEELVIVSLILLSMIWVITFSNLARSTHIIEVGDVVTSMSKGTTF